MMRKQGIRMAAFSLAALFLIAGAGEVLARAVEDIFAGKVLILKKKPPSYFRTKNGFAGFLRQQSTGTVYESQDKTWEFETMAFFRKPLGDYEVELMFYDIRDGRSENQRRFVNSYTQYTQDRNTRILAGKTKLIRPHFDADIKYMIIAQSHGKELAKGEFTTRGTSQAAIDQQKRYEHVQAEMEKSMKDLEKKAKEQEAAEKKRQEEQNKNAAKDLF